VITVNLSTAIFGITGSRRAAPFGLLARHVARPMAAIKYGVRPRSWCGGLRTPDGRGSDTVSAFTLSTGVRAPRIDVSVEGAI
jgi:hypothetical protein